MDNTYPAKQQFQIFILEKDAPTEEGNGCRLRNINQSHPDHDAAKMWIEDYGERKEAYTILEVFQKE